MTRAVDPWPYDLLAAILRSEITRWPLDGAPAESVFLGAACQQGVLPLLARQLRQGVILVDWPTRIRAALERAARQAAAVEQLQQQEIPLVLASLRSAGIRPLLMKGAALAYTHYPHPCLRPRADTDLLIEGSRAAEAGRLMEGLGYKRYNLTTGELVMAQSLYVKGDRYGVQHAYDIHWRVANPQIFADVLTLSEARRRAVNVLALGEHASALGSIHALLAACVHRVAHHNDSDRLIWIYDIHLLVDGLTAQEVSEFVELAAAKGVAAICARGLELARRCFGTVLPDDLAQLGREAAESSRAYLGGGLRRVDILCSDFKSLTGWNAKLRLLGEHAFPPAAYMLERYGMPARARLPALVPVLLAGLYAQRLVRGIAEWFRPIA